MKILVEAGSLLGQRENQQDYYLYRIDSPLSFAVVCDGMGGLYGGEVASEAAATQLKEDIKKSGVIENIPTFLGKEARKLDEMVFQLTDQRGRWIDTGTTLASVVIEENELYWLTVGDSLIFMKRGQEMQALNREHNYRLQLEQLLLEKKITKEDYLQEEKRAEQLISYLGMGNISVMDVNEKPLQLMDKDQLLLCSDGVTKTISREEIREILVKFPNPKMVVEHIMERIRAKNAKGQDNATCIAITCEEE